MYPRYGLGFAALQADPMYWICPDARLPDITATDHTGSGMSLCVLKGRVSLRHLHIPEPIEQGMNCPHGHWVV
jgi:hypothetical protein